MIILYGYGNCENNCLSICYLNCILCRQVRYQHTQSIGLNWMHWTNFKVIIEKNTMCVVFRKLAYYMLCVKLYNNKVFVPLKVNCGSRFCLNCVLFL